jgi:hypothetical protein
MSVIPRLQTGPQIKGARYSYCKVFPAKSSLN